MELPTGSNFFGAQIRTCSSNVIVFKEIQGVKVSLNIVSIEQKLSY